MCLVPKLLRGKLLRSSPGARDKTSILQRFGSLHRRFLNSLVWPEAAGLASVDVGTSTLEGCRWCLCLGGSHAGSMGRTVYLPIDFGWCLFMVNVGKYNQSHGSHGFFCYEKRSEERGGWGKKWMAWLFLGWKVCKFDFFHCINWTFATVLLLQIQLSCDCLVSTAFVHFFYQWFLVFFLETNDASTACKWAPCRTSSTGGRICNLWVNPFLREIFQP